MVVVLAAAAIGVVALQAPSALACPPMPNYNPIRDSDVVVLGRLEDSSGDTAASDTSRFDVSKVYKGDVPSKIDLRYVPPAGEHEAHLCEVHISDGWNLLALDLDAASGAYEPSLYGTMPIGPELEGEIYVQSISWLNAVGSGQLGFDANGHPPSAAQEESAEHDKDTPWAVVLPLAFGIPLAVLLIPAYLRRRSAGQ
jgi:hypothetical protein